MMKEKNKREGWICHVANTKAPTTSE